MNISITHIDTACILININGYKILTDPTLDGAGGFYYHGYGSFSTKTSSPAVSPEELQDVDLILLSHHQHKDNFDVEGKKFAMRHERIISTRTAAREMSNVTGLDKWETCEINSQKLSGLRITATPAQHHPWWIPEFVSGKVIGFVIEFDEQKNGVIYISGDTVLFDGMLEVAARYKIDIGIFHVGSVQFRYLTGLGRYTMNADDLIKVAGAMKPRTLIPIHQKGWTHFKESETNLYQKLTIDETTKNILLVLQSGVRTYIFPF